MSSNHPKRPTVALRLTAFTAIAVIFLSLSAAGTNAAGFSFIDSIRDILGIPAAETSVQRTLLIPEPARTPTTTDVPEPGGGIMTSATSVPMASQPSLTYSENFSDIANWTNNFAAGVGANRYQSVGVNATGTIPDGVRTTVSTATFTTTTSGGVQKGTANMVLLSTGATDNTNSVAVDLLLDFSTVNAGTLSFDWAQVANQTGDRKASLKIYTSTNGTTFTELTAAAVLNVTNNVASSGSITTVALPASFNNSSTAIIRFYEYNGTGGTTGSRAKISVDNVTVTATSGVTAPNSLVYSSNPATYTNGVAITNNTPSNGGGAPTLYGIAPALPTGLNFSTSTGVISGTPSVASAATDYTVTASNGGGSTNATVNITVNKGTQSTLTAVATPSTVVFGNTSTLSSTGGSGAGAVTFSSTGSTGCSVLGTTLSVTDASGTCAVTATKAADANFNAATSAALTVTLQKATQTTLVAVATPSTVVFGNTSTLSSTGGSGAGAVTFSSTGSTGCSVLGTTLSVTDASGTCAVTATKAADANYNAATSSALTVTLQKAAATITFGTAPTPTYLGGDFTVSASTTNSDSSALTYSVVSGPCALVSGATFSSSGAGTCVVQASGSASTNFNSATATQDVNIAKAEQATLTVDDPGAVVFGFAPQLTTSGGSGTGAVTYSHGGSSGCTVTSGGVLTVTDASGTCAVTASKAADTNYNSATSAAHTITLAKAAQATLTAVATPSTVVFGNTSALSSTGGSGTGAVTFSSGVSTGCSVTGSTLSVTNAAGSCEITATKAADINYNAATSAPLTVTLTKAAAVITFGAAPAATFPGADFTVSASTTNTDSSALTYSVVSGPCSHVSGATFSPTGAGTCVVKADGGATDNFEAASNTQNVTITQVTYTLTVVNGGHGTVTSSPAGINCGADCTESYNAGTPVTLTATPDAGYKFTGWSDDCTGVGTCNVTMNAAHTVTATFALNDVSANTSGNLAGGSYNNITVDGPAVVTLTGDVDVQGCVTINSGAAVVMGTFTFSGPGCFTLNPGGSLSSGSAAGITLSGATGSVQVAGTRTYSSIGSYTYNGSANQAVGDGLPGSVTNLTINNTGADGSNTVTGNGGQVVTGLLNVVDGTYESHSDYHNVTIAAAGTLTLTGATTVSGNWTNNGGMLSGNFPVTLDGATGQTITGNTTFYALAKSVTAAQTLNFAAGSTTTVTNSLTLNGTASNLLSLRSTVGGTQWNLNATGTRTAGYVDIQDSNAAGSISAINASNSVDSGNNTNWTFNTVTNYTITVTQTANGTISPGTTTVTSGSNATFHIVPNTGYDIATLVVDGVPVPVQSPYTFTNVTADHTLTATYAVAVCRTISIPTLSSTTGVPVTIPVNTTDVTGGNVISAQFKITYDPAVITPIAGADNVVVTPGAVLPPGTTIDINRATPGVISFSINGSTPFSGSGALVNLHMNVTGAPATSTPLTLTAIDPAFPTIFYNGGTVCASATSGSLSVIANATTTTVTSSPSGTSVYGDNVTFTATVSPAFTGGTVQFSIDGNPAGAPVPVVGGVAAFSTTALTVSGSPHTVTGDFSGFTPYAPSSGSTTITITPRPITVTAVSDTKVYDGTTVSSATPAITGTLANSDTAAFIQTFDTKHVGTGKTLTPSGTVNDGNGGTNYAITFVPVSTGSITAKPITVTAVSDSKNYDGTTSSSGTPTVSPSLAAGDTAGFVQVFDNRNAGTGKTLIPSGSVSDGNFGSNYSITFANNTTGVIIARAVTVTAVADSKVYDGTTASSGIPTISPALVGGDTSGFIQTFDNKNVGTGKTLTASGSVNDGNFGGNYAVTFVSNTAGEITARAITVTAAADTKVYDGTTASTGTPTITTGSLATGDTATFTQTFDTKHVGTGKTLTPSGSVSDGNGGANYVVTYTAVSTGVITAKPITVTAVSDTRAYDGTTASGGTPNISPALVGGDTSGFIQTFDTRHVGTGKTLTASGSVADGNSGSNYAVTFVANNTGVITARAVTVTAVTDTRGYDGTTASSGTPNVSPSLAGGDTAVLSQTFDNKNVGTGKTLTPLAVITDGNSGSNYAVTYVNNTTGVITARAITVTAAADTRVYDGTTASAGIPTITFGSLAVGDTAVFTQTFDTRHVGTGKTLTPAGTVTDGNGGNNYAVTYAATANGTITAKSATWTTDPASKTFGDADPVPLTTGSGSGFLPIDGVSAAYSRVAGEAASPPTYHITALLTAATGDLSDYAITNSGAEFTINARTLTGQVTYENAASPVVVVPHTTITAAGPAPLPAPVQNNLTTGNYSISGFGAGSYTITPSKAPYTVNINNGIFANDASLISQHVVHLITLNPAQQKAADVSGLGAITSFDAALIAQYIVGIPNPLNTSGNWVFTPASPSLTITSNSVQNFGGILMGDVSGDWAPETSRPAPANRFTSVRALLTDATAAPGSSVAVPLRLENMGGGGVTAYQFDIEYDPAVIAPAAVAATVNGTIGEGLGVVSNAPMPGLLKVVVYGALPVSGEGVYVNLQFSTIGGMGSTTPLNISQFRLNDGTAPVYTINGSVTVGRSDDNALRGRVMTPTGAGLANARVIATSSTGERFAVLAGSMGYFEFGGLAMNDTYTISVESKRYTFTPRTVSLTSNMGGIDMIADQ